MTVKIAKFFGASNNAVSSATGAGTPPPLPPPNATMSSNNKKYLRQQQQKQHNNLCLTYLDDIEDDNMSLYSTSASIMTTRDHPFNNSQRPLLGDKKPQAQILTTQQKKKKQQQQQQQQQTAAVTYHFEQQQHQQPYISPFVQQQKRDSAKGLHGFNDFDILSQQYNQHLQSPHIGYPYGSPPSPTANSNDFIFSDGQSAAMANGSAGTHRYQQPQQQPQHHHHHHLHNQQQISTTTPRYGNVPTTYAPPLSSWNLVCAQLTELDSFHSSASVNGAGAAAAAATAMTLGKSSRFEDDFCIRRNIEFSRHPSPAAVAASSSSCSSSSVSSGPFIFGPLPPEQQRDGLSLMNHHRLPAMGGRGFVGECQLEPALSSDSGVSVAGESGKFATHTNGHSILQSTSDTSSNSNGSNKKVAKLLLRKNKLKPKKKSTTTTTVKTSKDNEQQPHNEKTFTATNKQQTIKCVVVGDGAVGKTNLILSYLENRFIPEHVPTASDIYNADVMVNDSPVHLTLCDTAGQDTLDPLRELSYPDSDVFLLCFSVAKPETFHAIKTKWAPKFAKTRAALILVGTQADMRTNASVLNKLQTTGEKPISYADAWDLATTIGAKYIETSSATQDKVKEVFDTAIWEALRPNALPPTPPLWKKLLCLA